MVHGSGNRLGRLWTSERDRYDDAVEAPGRSGLAWPMPSAWPSLPSYGAWQPTCDTLHAHTQVLGKLAIALAPPEPQLQHGALRMTARGWETPLLPAPDGSGAILAALDLHTHEAVVEHSDGRVRQVSLTPNRPVGEVTQAFLEAVRTLAGDDIAINTTPQEVPWTVSLDADDEHATYDSAQVSEYVAAATQAALVLARFRAPYRGRSTPVNAWWGSFDLAVSLFSGAPADPPSDGFIMRNAMTAQEVTVGWWPGDARYGEPAFYAYSYPTPDGWVPTTPAPATARWDAALGEYVLDWSDVCAARDPAAAVMEFALSVFRHTCDLCGWDPALAASAEGSPPPIT
jgi:hypothetical protein